MSHRERRFSAVFVLLVGLAPRSSAVAQNKAAPRLHLADYDAELRLRGDRVDVDAMVERLGDLGVTTYYWLVWHKATDWDDLKLFLPKAAKAGIDVWVYLAPPSECPPKFGDRFSEPYRLDYVRWGEEIAKLSLAHQNLTAWVMDDFGVNHDLFTPAYVRQMQTKAKAVNPRLAFFPLLYFRQIQPKFVHDYREVVDGVVVAYLQEMREIERTWDMFNDADVPGKTELRYPWEKPSRPGDHVTVSQTAKVLPANRYEVRFRQRDSITGPTVGYHYKQLLIGGEVAWEEDVAGGTTDWHDVDVDVTAHVRGKSDVTLAFRLFDKKGVSNYAVEWQVTDLRTEHLRLAADLSKSQTWKVRRQGAFETGFGAPAKQGKRRFHVPFISMTAAHAHEFSMRHGDPASPERIAEKLALSLEAYRQGKCDGVVTYCLDKRNDSSTFPFARELFLKYRKRQ